MLSIVLEGTLSESKTGIHSKSMDNYKEFLNQVSRKKDPVEQQLSKSTVKHVDKNRKVLLSIIDAIKTIGKMGVPLRGHRDDSRCQPDVGEPANHPGVGNFIEFINFAVQQGNQTLGHHLKTCSSRETYISKTTPNLLLACCYDIITETIIGRVKEAKFYSVICDEASDASSKEQFSFCLRYVNDDGDICEDFLKFIHCKSGLTGKDLYNEVTEALTSFGLDLQNCCGQGYDGDGAVSGHFNGLSALILRENSKALYTHCASHRLNLVIGTSCKISTVHNLMDVIKDISYFFNFSPIRAEHLQNFIKKYEQGRTKCKLIDVCNNR